MKRIVGKDSEGLNEFTEGLVLLGLNGHYSVFWTLSCMLSGSQHHSQV